ncbi:ImmA/IrrE family metallo-endopeptidase [Paenibacillus sp. FSL R5-808]|jgi:Zn-dependent peptidase ImmA (M78 family)|uniref:ImmA/IrrE family metallo-endopeptidase n=1 Tax=unclassified Paenibacillus TaxID=185978 RepID=UPI0003E28536|nr:ImmA/IrrE family metallo-endopeptidase [Paenibacillus sp. FSL R5-808]ETT32169.1 Zn peptidase [Paenibacillus sp. FSL R5-808]
MDSTIHKLVQKFKTNNPFEIANELNILIRYAELGEGTRGLYYRKLRRRFIVIDNGLNEIWQTFVCAHELGHDRLHPGLSQFWIDEHTFFNVGKFERQANTFAVKLLTHMIKQEQEEPLEHYLLRCGIPKELHKIYK